jgi:hypothetical protein
MNVKELIDLLNQLPDSSKNLEIRSQIDDRIMYPNVSISHVKINDQNNCIFLMASHTEHTRRSMKNGLVKFWNEWDGLRE